MNEMLQSITNIFIENGFLITQAQAARLLKVTPGRINQMITEGKIKGVKILDTVMVKLSDIQKWI